MLQYDWVGTPLISFLWEAPHDLYHCVFYQVDSYQLCSLVGVGIKADIQGSAGLGVFSTENVNNRFTCLGACVTWMHHPSLILICYPNHYSPEIPPEHQAVKGPCPVLLQIVSVGGIEVVILRLSRLLDQNLVLTNKIIIPIQNIY